MGKLSEELEVELSETEDFDFDSLDDIDFDSLDGTADDIEDLLDECDILDDMKFTEEELSGLNLDSLDDIFD